jgi:CelD/BcsL family acetyltransferase involved in cellulose biosynthesis
MDSDPAAGACAVEVDPAPGADWDEFVRDHPHGTAYHLAAWAEVLRSAYRFRPLYLTLKGPTGRLEGAMPLVYGNGLISGSRLVSLPLVRWAGPLARNSEGEAALLGKACELVNEGEAKRLHIVSARAGLNRLHPGFAVHETDPVWWLKLPSDLDTFRARFKERSKSLPRNVRKAEREGVSVRESESVADLRAFYRLYLRTMRQQRVPPRNLRQLLAARRLLEPAGVFKLFVAELDGRIVAGGIFHFFGRVVDLMYNASDYRYLHVRPNHALYWEVIRRAIESGMQMFDFGGAEPGTTLAEFKQRWGAEPVPRWKHDYPAREGRPTTAMARSMGANRVFRAAWGRAPLALTRVTASIAYRYL